MGNRKFPLLYPFSILYRFITDVRNVLYDKGILPSEEFNVPVICVGNITVGGTGKTPHTEYLINLLKDEFKVAFLSRGYKRKSKGFLIAGPLSTVRETGDEPMQIYRKYTDIIVAVGRDRGNGIKSIMKEHPGTNVVILDDGFQHRKIKPGISIILSDYGRLITRDFLMPYGTLRETSENRKRADIIVISKTPENVNESEMREISDEIKPCPGQRLFFTKICYKDLIPLYEITDSKRYKISETYGEDNGVVLITGIAAPDSLYQFLKKKYGEIIHLDFPDHHYFNENDIDKVKTAWKNLKSKEKILITTEKDAVRLREFLNIEDSLKRAFYYIPVKVSFVKNDKHEFDNLILDYVRKNKRNNRVSQSSRDN